MDYISLTAPCGLDCFNCVMYLAVESPSLRRDLAEKLGLDEDQAQCRGCRGEEGKIAFLGMAEPCAAFTCAKERGLRFCNDCDEFPCERLNADSHAPNGEAANGNMVYSRCLVRRMGLEE